MGWSGGAKRHWNWFRGPVSGVHVEALNKGGRWTMWLAEIFDNLIGCTNLLRQINFEFNRDLFNLTFFK